MRRFIIPVLALAVLSASCQRRARKPDLSSYVEALKSPDENVYGKATADLVIVGEPAVAVLVPLLSDPEPRVRRVAAATLWGLGKKARAAIPELSNALADEDASVRASAAMALSAMGQDAKEAVPRLTRALNDGNSNVRMWAVKALGEIGPASEAALPALEHTLKDEFLRPSVEEAIRKINAEASVKTARGAATPGARRRDSR